MEFEFFTFTHDELPVTKNYLVGGILYQITLMYNETSNFYTAELADTDGNLIMTSKFVYGNELFHARKKEIPLKSLFPIAFNDLESEFPYDSPFVKKETLKDISVVIT